MLLVLLLHQQQHQQQKGARAAPSTAPRRCVRLEEGHAEVAVHPGFRLFLATTAANPAFPPDVCARVTLVNCSVTPQGLEDQLLAQVVAQERPELEAQRGQLVAAIAADRRQLQEAEERILALLHECQGSILDNEHLINTLSNARSTSAAIQVGVWACCAVPAMAHAHGSKRPFWINRITLLAAARLPARLTAGARCRG